MSVENPPKIGFIRGFAIPARGRAAAGDEKTAPWKEAVGVSVLDSVPEEHDVRDPDVSDAPVALEAPGTPEG